jgi:hypothetical protein
MTRRKDNLQNAPAASRAVDGKGPHDDGDHQPHQAPAEHDEQDGHRQWARDPVEGDAGQARSHIPRVPRSHPLSS